MEEMWTVPMHKNACAIKFIKCIAANVLTLLNNDDGSSFSGITFRYDRSCETRSYN
jgi:hypothetical protein